MFRSTPPRGGDARVREGPFPPCVSIHAPARERQLIARIYAETGVFRSTPPRESDAHHRRPRHQRPRFDPRPRERATASGQRPDRAGAVSIHAPARERRGEGGCWGPSTSFRSTPPRGSDARPAPRWAGSSSFDPRPREGATVHRPQQRLAGQVSIHAPARERPRPARTPSRGWRRFDPRPREGATRSRARINRHGDGFDPRPREGATLYVVPLFPLWEFRSTPPRGSDAEG